MNKLKMRKIGLSALAGTLVSLSAAQAGGVTVSGSWELSYTTLDNNEVTGNPIGMNKNISFGASGDVTSGGGVTWATSVAGDDAMGLSSAYMTMNFGGIMTLAYDSGDGSWGANSVDNIVPTAWEEIDAGFSTGLSDVGRVSKSLGVLNVTVKAPTAGTALSISYVNSVGGTHNADGSTSGEQDGGTGYDAYLDFVNVNMSQFGYRLGVGGQIEVFDETCNTQDTPTNEVTSCSIGHEGNPWGGTAYTSLRLGPFSAGFQGTYLDPSVLGTTAVANNLAYVGGVAVTIGNYISVSYGEGIEERQYNDADRDGGEYVFSHFEGYSAAINMGPVALKYFDNEADHIGGNTSTSDNHREINLSIAF